LTHVAEVIARLDALVPIERTPAPKATADAHR
jgi:hypothetical protein